jgi:hypothetical protein
MVAYHRATVVNLGYLIPEFRGQTDIFFWRKIQARRRIGEEVALLSTRQPSYACRHEFVSAAVAGTRYRFPPDETGGGGFHKVLDTLINDLHLTEDVILLGAVGEQRVLDGLRAAHIFVCRRTMNRLAWQSWKR